MAKHTFRTTLATWMAGALMSSMLVCTASAAEPDRGALTIDRAVATAVASNPGLDELRRRAAAAAAIPSQVGTLPDPRLNFGAANLPVDTFALDQEPMTQLQIGVTQVFPFPGKLGLRREMAQAEADAAADSVDEARLRLVRDVRVLWWELFYLDRAIETVERNRSLLRQLVDVARTKYEVGRGLQQDVLLAQVELSRLQDMALQIDGMRAMSGARFNALLAQPAQTPVPMLRTASSELPEPPDAAELQALAERGRPWLSQLRHQLDAALSAQALARKEYVPDLGVTASYGWRDGNNADRSARADFASAMISISLPLFASRKQDQLVAQRGAERAAREQALADARNRVHADIAAALADYRRARDEMALFDDGILPQTAQAVESMLAGYQVNKVDFLTLVRTQVTLYNHELQRWRALSQAQQALATLNAAAGKETFDE
ncbi:MAG: TolC family protein [Pseudomonadota bacterium]|nr:TolC family protein [Pseudomonadota bacterium]